MIAIDTITDYVRDSRALLNDRRSALLLLTQKYLKQIKYAEDNITHKSSRQYVKRVNDQREFIDELIQFIQETDTISKQFSGIISNMLEFHEAEIRSGGRFIQGAEFWQRQYHIQWKAKRRVISAFSKVLNEEQNKELFKLLIDG